MLKPVGLAFALLFFSSFSPVFAQQPASPPNAAVSKKPGAKPATTRGILVEESKEAPVPAVAAPPEPAPVAEGEVTKAKPAEPVAAVAKPGDAGPPPVSAKPGPAVNPPPAKKPVLLKGPPVVRAKPPHRPRYG